MAMGPQQQALYDILAQQDPAAAQSYAAHFAPAPVAQPASVATPLYQGLSATSTPAQIAAAYSQFVGGAGGDTTANQDAARSYLTSLGIAAPTIEQSYNQFLQPVAAPAQDYFGGPDTSVAATTPTYNFEQMVRDAYGSIGRTGIGTEAANIDQEGFNNWVNALQSGSINPADLTNTFRSSVADYLIANPTDQYSTYVTDFLSGNRPAAVSGIVDLYRDVLGRDPDAGGLGNWFKQFGEEISPEERAEFERAARPELYSSIPDSIFSTYETLYGKAPDDATFADLTKRFGPTFDADELRELVVNDFSLRDDPRGVVKTLQQQILNQGFTSKWSGEGFGSAEKNAADMARMLATAGITDINQFGKVTVAADAAVTPVYGERLVVDPEYGEYMGRYVTHYVDASGKAVDPSLVTQDPETGQSFAPVGTKQVFGNKETGVALDPRYDRAGGNIFSGTFAGDGSTGYGVQFREDGAPVFYTQFGGSTNTLKQIMDDVGPLGQIALAVATGGLSIPQQIAAQAAISLASGADIKDIAKNVATSVILSKIPGSDLIKDGTKYLNSIDTSGVLGNAFKSAAASGTRAALTGKDIGDAILSGAVGGGAAGAIDLMAEGVTGFEKLTKSEQSMVKNAISGVVSGRPLDQVLINAAIQAGRDAVRTASSQGPSGGGITNRVVDGAIPQGDGTTNVLADAGLVTGDGQFADAGTLTDQNLADILGDTSGSYTGSKVAGPGDGATAGTFVPSWMSLASDERIVETRPTENGVSSYVVERTNPNNPDQALTYKVTRNPDTGLLRYEVLSSIGTGDIEADGAEFGSLLSRTKPKVDWETEGAKSGSGDITQKEAPTIDDEFFLDALLGFGKIGSGSKGSVDLASLLGPSGGAPGTSGAAGATTSGGATGGGATGGGAGSGTTGGAIAGGDAVVAGVTGSGAGTGPTAGAGGGTGTGTGAGTGTGTGGGSGSGSGTGTGAGDGTGTGSGLGSGSGAGTGSGAGAGAGAGSGTGSGASTGTTPKVTPKQVAQILGVPVSSPIVQDVIEALYGTMEYLDIGEDFEPSKRKAKPAATQKQQQQTKMAQGGYLDDLLAENMSTDDLLKLLR